LEQVGGRSAGGYTIIEENMKRIAIDMRMGGKNFGIGRYVTELADALLTSGTEFKFTLIFDKNFNKQLYDEYNGKGFDCILVDAPYYSLKEQLVLPTFFLKHRFDLVHFPNFNVPIFFPGKFVMTIHDLIHHQYPGKKKRNFLYRLGYKTIINVAAIRAQRILSVSESTKNDIIRVLKVPAEKIIVVPEGVSERFGQVFTDLAKKKLKEKYSITRSYILFIGEWRRYKNVPLLAKAFSRLPDEFRSKYQLVLAGGQDPHYPDVLAEVRDYQNNSSIVITGKVSDDELPLLYKMADWYVSPSASEGFGLTNLEAQKSGVPVLSSDIPVAREVLGSSAVFFKPEVEDLLKVLKEILYSGEIRQRYIQAGLKNAEKYSWEKTALKTKEIYKQTLLKK